MTENGSGLLFQAVFGDVVQQHLVVWMIKDISNGINDKRKQGTKVSFFPREQLKVEGLIKFSHG